MSEKRAAARDQPLAHLSQPFTGISRGSSFHKAPVHEGDKKVGSSIFLGFNLDFFFPRTSSWHRPCCIPDPRLPVGLLKSISAENLQQRKGWGTICPMDNCQVKQQWRYKWLISVYFTTVSSYQHLKEISHSSPGCPSTAQRCPTASQPGLPRQPRSEHKQHETKCTVILWQSL